MRGSRGRLVRDVPKTLARLKPPNVGAKRAPRTGVDGTRCCWQALRLSEGFGVMWTGREQMKAVFIVVALAVIAITLTGAVTAKSDCEAKGGTRLRGTWAWEGFECYDARTLKVLP